MARILGLSLFFAPHTLEVDFALADARVNSDYISEVVELIMLILIRLRDIKKI